jgi:hypothetical protein
MNAILTPSEFYERAANLWAKCAWNANHYCYDLFIDDQMNEGIDLHDGTMYREEVLV